MKKPSIIIIREQDELVASCCVPLDGEFVREVGNVDLFISQREDIESTGALYSTLLEEFQDQIELVIVDPRNPLYLIPKLFKEVIENRVSFFQSLKTLLFYRMPAVVLNGELVSSGNKTFTHDFIDSVREKIKK